MLRTVRVGRPANDNHHRHRWLRSFMLLGLAGVLLALLAVGARLT